MKQLNNLSASTLRPPTPGATPGKDRTIWTLPLLSLFVGITIALGAAYESNLEITQSAQARMKQHVDSLEQQILGQFEVPMIGLRGLAGFFDATPTVDREKFRAYWQSRDIVREFPGVRGFGYIQQVHRADLARFIEAERNSGVRDFSVDTQGDAEELYVNRFVEPIANNRTARGLDVGREAVRRAAVLKAIQSGQPVLSGTITLVQDNKKGPGFLYLIPLTDKSAARPAANPRRPQPVGLVYSPIVLEEVLASTVDLNRGLTDFQLFDDGQLRPDKLLFDSTRPLLSTAGTDVASPRGTPLFQAQRAINIGGHAMVLMASSTPAFESGVDSTRPLLIGAGGSLLTLLIAITLWLMSRGQSLAEEKARIMSADLVRLARVAENTNNSVIIANEKYRIEWVNKAFERISGYQRDEAIGRRVSDLRDSLHADPDTLSRIHAALVKGESIRAQTHNRAPDGREYWLDADIHSIRDDKGVFKGYVAVETDITSEKEMSEKLHAAIRDNEALMQTILTHAIVSEADASGRITNINQAFIDISGYSREELLGNDHRIVNSGVQPRSFWIDMWKTIASGKPWRGQVCNRAKNGSLYWVDSLIAPFVDENGKIQRYVSIRTDITEAKLAEAELKRERERLENIILGTNVGTWETNLQTGESRIDERWASMLGYRLDELRPFTYEKWTAMVPPADMQVSRTRFADHVTGKTDYYECEHRARHKNGHWVWVLSRGKIASRTPDGRAEWFAGTQMDVTDRRTLFDQVTHSNEMMTAIMDNLPCGLSVFDADLQLVSDNPLFRKLLDLPESLFASSVTHFEQIIRYNAQRGEYGPGDTEAIVSSIVERARRPVPHRLERRRPNGMTLEVRGGPMPGGGLITTYTDITEQKKAEAEAHRSGLMLRASIDALDEAFVLYDPQDRLVLCNQRYRDVYPLCADVIVPGNTFEEIIRYGAERGEYTAALGRVDEWVAERMRIHRAANTDLIQELETGRVLRILERKTPEDYIVGFRIDITDLVRAKEAAEIASRSKSQFLANMSHEIRTPMNAILGMLNLLQGTELDTRQLDYVSKTEGAAKSLLGLLNDILDFSKVEAGKMSLEPHPFRMDQLMRDLGVILSASTGTKEVEVLFDLDPRLPVALIGDSLRLKQILINLGGNALKFTERGEVVVRTRVIDLQPQHVTLEFSVRDTGIGIAPEDIQRIFEGFSQAEASTTRRFGGTGLGLTISSRLVGLMGGQLDLDSVPGKGSDFHFSVTLGVDPAAATMPGQDAPEELRQLSVLIIDDNQAARDIMLGMLTSMGWQAEVAASGEQGLACIEARAAADQPPFQVILVDWNMPGMDGWETSLRIRYAMAGSNAPILVMVTAHGREMLAQRSASEQSLLDGYLVKPVTPSMLIDAVMLARSPGRGQGARKVAPQDRPRRLHAMRVLLVEDSKVNQQVAQELLSREGAQVTLADNGQQGVQAVVQADLAFDAVLMDVQMPVMDGYTATRAIRRLPGFHALPIIAMTANAMASDRQDSLQAGMNDHVGKPFELDQLVATLLRQTGYTPPAEGLSASPAGHVSPVLEIPPGKPAELKEGEIDFHGALQRLGGDAKLLARILKAFTKDLAHVPEQLAAFLDAGQSEEAVRLMHTLKGTAATLGARQLADVAARAEISVKAGLSREAQVALLQSVQQSIVAAVLGVAALMEKLPPDIASGDGSEDEANVDMGQLRTDLVELMGLLRQSDLGSLEVFSRLQASHGPAMQRELDPLSEAMAGLDFALASTLCEALSQKYAA